MAPQRQRKRKKQERRPPLRSDPPVAAIDIGSNTVHLLVARGRAGERLEHLHSDSVLLELGRRVHSDGVLGREALEQTLAVLKAQLKTARSFGVVDVLVAATGACRQAKDGKTFVNKLARELDHPIRLISGHREAALAYLGVRPFLKRSGTQLVIDSGGASTEVTLSSRRRVVATASLPVGAAMLSALLKNDPPRPLEWARLMILVAETLGTAPLSPRPTSAVATGGSAHRFEELRGRKGRPIRLKDLEKIASDLLQHPSEKLARINGHAPRRIALLSAGALILHAVLSHYGLKKARVVHAGLRDGMVHAFLTRAGNWWR